MVRLFALLAAGIVAISSPAHAFDPLGQPYRAVPADLAKTCDHYDNRARFKPRGQSAELEVLFADSCNAALRSLVVSLDTNPYQARRARNYLKRLHNLRTTVISMNTERLFGPQAHPRAMPLNPAHPGTSAFTARNRTVSPAGEYLIAREMGVLDAYQAWARAANFEIAAR